MFPPAVPTFLPSYIREDLGGSSADVSIVLAIQGAANTAGRVVLGLAADAWPRHKLNMLLACMGTMLVTTTILASINSLGFVYAYAVVLGGLGGAAASLQPAIVVDAAGLAAVPVLQSAFNAIQAPFVLAAPPAGGAIRAATGEGCTTRWRLH